MNPAQGSSGGQAVTDPNPRVLWEDGGNPGFRQIGRWFRVRLPKNKMRRLRIKKGSRSSFRIPGGRAGGAPVEGPRGGSGPVGRSGGGLDLAKSRKVLRDALATPLPG